MAKRQVKQTPSHILTRRLTENFSVLSRRILRYANQGYPRTEFIREIAKILLDFSGCSAIELWTKEHNKYFRSKAIQHHEESISVESMPAKQNENGEIFLGLQVESELEKLYKNILHGQIDPSLSNFTKNGSFWTGDLKTPLSFRLRSAGQEHVYQLGISGDYKSLAIIPFVIDKNNNGLLQLMSRQPDYFKKYEIEFYESVAQTLGVAMAVRRAQAALRERVKELTCLYGIAQIVEKPGILLKKILQGIVELLPPAWFYPEIASARIVLDDVSYITAEFKEGVHNQTADIVVNEKRRGKVEVCYNEERPEIHEGPFLKEERNLINAVARQIELILERKQSEEEKSKLEVQLLHADRLATIGQLAAGVAHELNEPLGNILGFAQLAKKCAGLPKQAEKDIGKIVNASLYSREVIKKLLIFSRQTPSKKTKVNLNRVVEEGLSFFEARCARSGIELSRSLSTNLPDITADSAQLNQVLVNLVVNAVQATPEGGRIAIQTFASQNYVTLCVEDTGIGMSKKILNQIFLPFFTTKDIDEGTGLGLPVVHGIVTAHGGSIEVESKPGFGTQFEIRLPLTELQVTDEED